jgi:hypothetical protein
MGHPRFVQYREHLERVVSGTLVREVSKNFTVLPGAGSRKLLMWIGLWTGMRRVPKNLVTNQGGHVMKATRLLIPGALLLSLLLLLSGCTKPGANANAPNTSNAATSAETANSANGLNTSNPTASSAATNNPQSNPAASSQTSNNPQSVTNAPPAGGAPASSQAAQGVSASAAGATPQQAPVPQPLTIPAGTSVTIRLQQGLSSKSAVAGERFEGVLDKPIVVDDQTVVPVGTVVLGHVVAARHSGRLRHPGELALTLDTLVVGQQNVPIVTTDFVARGGSHKKRNLAWIGGGTGGGALIGALAAGGKGALIGGGIGAAAGTTTALLTGKKDVGFGVERRLRFRLNRDVSLPG